MKKDLLIHFTYMLSFFILIALYKDWLELSYLPFLFGGIIGTLLPDLDHLIYVYFLKPDEVASRQVTGLLSKGELVKSLNLLAETRDQRAGLIFHSVFFQILFLVFSFLVVTSSGSLLGVGIVLAFSLHLLIDQIVDYMETKNVDSWFVKFPFQLDSEQKIWYMVGYSALLIVLGFFL